MIDYNTLLKFKIGDRVRHRLSEMTSNRWLPGIQEKDVPPAYTGLVCSRGIIEHHCGMEKVYRIRWVRNDGVIDPREIIMCTEEELVLVTE